MIERDKLRWSIIRSLLKKSEQVYLYEALESHYKKVKGERYIEPYQEWSQGEMNLINDLKLKIAGEENYQLWS